MVIKKFVIATLFLGLLFVISSIILSLKAKTYTNNTILVEPIVLDKNTNPFKGLLGVLPQKEPVKQEINELGKDGILSLLLLGIDRRSREETGYRTDIMIQLIVNTKTNSAVMISIPRDLWVNGQRVNAIFVAEGWESMQSAVENITTFKPEKYILTDFADFSWIVDAMGGVPVTVERTFVDSSYPVDATKGYQTVTFNEGSEILTGERALIYARSRKGTNGEGSDWARMKRQHLILKGMLTAIIQPKSIFNPMVIENAYNTVTKGKMDTNLTVADTQYLWDFYKDKDLYKINSKFLDSEYLYNPPMEDFGGAWVMIPQVGGYERFNKEVNDLLMLNQ